MQDREPPQAGRAMLLVTIQIDPAWEEEFNRWYDEEHLPERAALPGFLSARRFRAADGSPTYVAVYELESLDALATPEYEALPRWSEWTERIREHFRSIVRLELVELDRPVAHASGAR